MYVGCHAPEEEKIYDHVDIIGFNRYYGWYRIPESEFEPFCGEGDLEQAAKSLARCIDRFAERYEKPLFITEFGAETIAGLHSMAGKQFSEEFQERFIATYLDVIESKNAMSGAHVWNFADFDTRQETSRVDGNKKGVFTRDREPKRAAFLLRDRWRNRTTVPNRH